MARYEDNGDGFLTRGDTLVQYVDNDEHVVIPDGIKRIKSEAFSHCDKIKTIALPRSVVRVDPFAFEFCESLEDFFVDDGNPTYRAAEHCLIDANKKTLVAGLKHSVIPSDGSVDKIGFGAFSPNGCDARIVIPDGISDIGDCAFCGSDLENAVLPPSVKIVRSAAFAHCNKLETVVVSEGTQTIEDDAFGNCKKLKSVKLPDSLISIGKKAFYLCVNLRDLRLPSGLESIGDFAFSGCEKRTGELFIPKRLTRIGVGALFPQNGITCVTVEQGNEKYHGAGDCLIETVGKKVVLGCANSVIPDDGSVTVIGFCSFSGCKELKSIVIPESIEEIESYAFSDSGLKSVTLPKGFDNIGQYAFGHNVKLKRK